MEAFCGKFNLIHIDLMSTADVCGSFGSPNSNSESNEVMRSHQSLGQRLNNSMNRKDTISVWAHWTYTLYSKIPSAS